MRLKKFIKKAFTLVELVVVIAVVAILASVSVGLYFGITTTANKSVDEQVVAQFNKLLQLYEIQEGGARTQVEGVRNIFRDNGMSNFRTFHSKNTFYWDSNKDVNRILIWEEDEGVTYPATLASEFDDVTEPISGRWIELLGSCVNGHQKAERKECPSNCAETNKLHNEHHEDGGYYKCNECGFEQKTPMASVKERDVNSPTEDIFDREDPSVPLINGSSHLDSSFNGTITGLEVKYTFEIALNETVETAGKYADYYADFRFKFSKENHIVGDTVAYAESLGLWGMYGEFNVYFASPMDLVAGDQFPLLNSLSSPWTYEGIISNVRTFTCGAWNISPENKGLVMTVELCLWDNTLIETPEKGCLYDAPEPIIVGSWSHTFSGESQVA